MITNLGTSDGRGYVASYIRSGRKYHLLSLLETAADPHMRLHSPMHAMHAYTTRSGRTSYSPVGIRDGTDLIVAAQGAADGDGEVLFVRAPELMVLKRFVQPSPHGSAISFDSRFVYITNIAEGGGNAVITYDLATRAEVPGCAALTTSEPVPHNPAVTLDGGQLFITHSGAEATVTSTCEIDASGCPVQSMEKLITTGLN
eukprot:jgi/Ulvmu1/6729/UM030_0064.1